MDVSGRAALKNCGYDIPPTHITINLAPADIRKEDAVEKWCGENAAKCQK